MKKSREQVISTLLEDRVKLATVSGILTTKPSMIKWVDQSIPEIELITTKSYQVNPNPGNREPIVVETDVGCFGNAVGLRNPGMEQGYHELTELRKQYDLRAILNVSLSANSIEDFITLGNRFKDVADMLELNFSCPHAATGYGASIGTDAELVGKYMLEIRDALGNKVILVPKLTPNVDEVEEVAYLALMNGADGISAINTVGPECYFEPHTGKPILYNPKGHVGGMSGRWIHQIAVSKVEEIKEVLGGDRILIGMGGVSTSEDVERMHDTGANIVGIGSAIAQVSRADLPRYFEALKIDANHGSNLANKHVTHHRLAEYQPFKIEQIVEKGDNLKLFQLEGSLDYLASQFAFLWVPEVGEKPFSIAKSDPLTFVVRQRDYDPEQSKGLVTNALFQLQEGDELMLRGVYGAEAPSSDQENAYIVAGGTGIAVVPKLAEKLFSEGKKVTVFYGFTDPEETVLLDELCKYATLVQVPDLDTPGRVLETFRQDFEGTELHRDIDKSCFYNVGPVPLMEKAMQLQEELGATPEEIYSSLETNNMCGVGLCGECVCGEQLTCQDGTFFSLDYLRKNHIDINKI
jgi:dihydroorotate dehydrogenase subfamily 1